MRKLFALILVLALLPVFPALAAKKTETKETATPAPTLTPEEWGSKPVAHEREPEHIEVVPLEELPPVIEGQHHYLLLCIDQWKRDPRPDNAKPPTLHGLRRDMYGNTDGIMLVTLDTRSHRIMLTSIIRDAIIRKITSTDTKELHGRINYVYNDLGPEALCQTISMHLGVKIEKYILFTFKQLANIIDYLGGVQVTLNTQEEIKKLKGVVYEGTVFDPNGKDICASGIHPTGVYTFRTDESLIERNKKIDADPDKIGKHTAGVSAVVYMRIRKDSAQGDLLRTQRARNVIQALSKKCKAMTWEEAQGLANNILENNNKTNMNLNDILEAAKYAFDLRECTIEELRIPHEDQARRPILFNNMLAQEINWPYCREAFQEYLQNSFLVVDDEDEDF